VAGYETLIFHTSPQERGRFWKHMKKVQVPKNVAGYGNFDKKDKSPKPGRLWKL
jgi:hypothetical protein